MLNTNSNEKLYMFESFISEAPGPVAIFDNEVKYLACSKKWLEVYSINKENIIGLNHYDLFPETPDDWKQVHIRCLNGETISRDEDKFARLDCSVQWVSWSLSPWHKQDGSIGGFIAYTNDITDYVENKLEIEKQLQSMREAQELANIGHWELDLIENNLYWSDEVYRIFGLNPQEFEATYEAFLDRIHPDDREMVNNAYSTSVANRTSYHIVHRVLTIDGKIKYVEERCLHDFDSSGNVKRSIGTVHDITESIKSKKEIELASKVFENTQEGILISDENNTIIKVNDAYTKITGFTEEELVGNNPRAINSGWQNDEFYQTMWDSISEKGYWSGELLDRKKDGTLFQAELSISTVRNDKNEIINYIAIISDITDRKEKEDKIHRMAYYDFLTNVPNRTLVQERVKHLIKTHRESKQFALMLMDADNFKLINDTLGHKLGDEFLKSFANRITEILPESVTFGRLGGDEFIVLVEDIQELKDVTRIATNILEEARKPFNISNNIVHVSVSMGISVFPDNGGSYDNLIMNADTAMYSVKKDTKNDFTQVK
jgi:diguanylate cyclase (GGDEF)-like protein/PAS domain S-box-containing protein